MTFYLAGVGCALVSRGFQDESNQIVEQLVFEVE